ncbi:hypothetical protein FBU30_003412 [Linnemannia zychae]|nr:hypothetical protein FBU30_003412 [Linnemannia zychae]
MWQEEVSLNDTLSTTSSDKRYHKIAEPNSPEPDTFLNQPQLPSSNLPVDFSARPTYTIGTRSHSYATEHRKSIPFPIPTTPTSFSSPSSSLASPAAESSFSSSAILDMDPDTTLTTLAPKQLVDLEDSSDITTTDLTAISPVSPPATPSSKRASHNRASSLQRTNSTISNSSSKRIESASAALTGLTSPPVAPVSNGSHARPSSLSLSLSRNSSLSKKTGSRQQQQQDYVPPSPSSTHRPQKHVMLHRQSTSQDFQLRLQQQQQRQDDLGEEASEAGEDQIPGTPTSISSFGSGTMVMSGSEREREKSASIRQKRQSRSLALIENRNIQTLSSNLAMVASPTDSEFPAQQTSDSLLSVIAQKEARIAQLREDLETNLAELTQLKERWSQMMIEERNRQQAEASASIQEQEKQHYGHSSAHSVSHRLSTTGAGIWGSVVGSVSGISGVSGGISLHHINNLHTQQIQSSQSLASGNGHSGRSSTNSRDTSSGTAAASTASGQSRPTSPLPTYLNNYSSLNGLNSPVSPNGQGGTNLSSALMAKRGDRASLSSLSTCSSTPSNAGDAPLAFEAGHSSQSSISSSTGHPDNQQRDARKMKRESSGLFIPPEAEEVLVNTGRALFKGFGSLIGGIRTVVNDVTESDRFQHSRQRTMDMMSGLAQSAADALPLKQEKERRLLEKGQGSGNGSGSETSSGLNRSGSLVRRASSRNKLGTRVTDKSVDKSEEKEEREKEEEVSSKTIQQLSIQDEDGEGQEWEVEDKDLMASLEAEVSRGQENTLKNVDFENHRIHTDDKSSRDTPTIAPFATLSKKND